jgi:hypothetical protein
MNRYNLRSEIIKGFNADSDSLKIDPRDTSCVYHVVQRFCALTFQVA